MVPSEDWVVPNLAPMLDDVVVADFTDAAQCVEKASSLAGERRIDGVVCYGQVGVHRANQIAHSLGLTPLWDDPEVDLANKRHMYELWSSQGVAHPRAERVTGPYDPRLEEFAYPVVVKPTSMMGGYGVRKCASPREASDWISFVTSGETWATSSPRARQLFFDYSPEEKHVSLVQEFVEPDELEGRKPEFTVECAVSHGNVGVIGVFEKFHGEPPFFDESLFLMPALSLSEGNELKIERAVKEAVTALGFHSGLCHVEFCLKDGEIVFYELNPRLIGHPGGQILASVYGLDVPGLLVDLACGGVGLPNVEREGYGGFVDIRAGRDLAGAIFSGIDQTNPPSGVQELRLSYPVGKEIFIPKIRGAQEMAQAVFLCRTADELRDNAAYWTSAERVLVG